MILHIGDEDRPFPIPIVKTGKGCQFNTEEGREKVIAGRIGRNELITIQGCLSYVDAQREYAMMDHDDDGFLEYARQFKSDPGMQNGLYWPETEGNPISPIGALVVAAESKGYEMVEDDEGVDPFFGYYFRILEEQGKHANGGAYEYVINGKMMLIFKLNWSLFSNYFDQMMGFSDELNRNYDKGVIILVEVFKRLYHLPQILPVTLKGRNIRPWAS